MSALGSVRRTWSAHLPETTSSALARKYNTGTVQSASASVTSTASASRARQASASAPACRWASASSALSSDVAYPPISAFSCDVAGYIRKSQGRARWRIQRGR